MNKLLTENFTPMGGYSIPLSMALNSSQSQNMQELRKLAQQILQDHKLQMMLTDRVYALMQEDLTYDKERGRSYGGLI